MARRVSLETVDLKLAKAKAKAPVGRPKVSEEDLQAQTLRLPRDFWRKVRRLAAYRDTSMVGLIHAVMEKEFASANAKEQSFLG